MNKLEATNLLKTLLQQDVEQVQSWLKSVLSEQEQVPENFNWLGLAESSTFNAQELVGKSNEDNLSSLAWAEVSISIYEFLAKNNSRFSDRYLSSSMSLRAYMIIRIGTISGHSILDIEQILDWFFARLEFSYEEALIKATAWRDALSKNNPEDNQKYFDANLEDIKILRDIKNRLIIIKLLYDNKKIDTTKELNAWISLWEKLP
ncbi:hypothetical protein LC607_34850 [Nostoc sp. CHAB 5824]|nr:hypothetical protein [Nostoc sp. CHAB 5824]